MGTSANIYGIYGVKLEFNDEFSELYDELDPLDPDFDVIVDGMGGEYIIIGHKFFDSGDMLRGDTDDELAVIDPAMLSGIETKCKLAFTKAFPDHANLVDAPFSLIVVTHWS